MKKTLAFCLFKYFPHGGLQRDMQRIALACQRRGYAIAVYTTAWEGELPDGFELHARCPSGWSNHTRMQCYHQWVTDELSRRDAACVVGFNKMPGLNVYFAADSCFEARARARGSLFRLTGRYRTYAALEAAVFSPASSTEILLIAEPQRQAFQQCYGTPDDRLHLLPPWIAPDRRRIEDRPAARQAARESLGVAPGTLLLLQVGSGFKTKGVDRTLRALAALPASQREQTRLAVVGRDRSKAYKHLSHRLGLAETVMFLGERDDVMELMAGADLLIHPARNEAAGVVLIEAMVSGLPVLCSGICGHAGHIRKAQAGLVLSEPFQQTELNRCLLDMVTGGNLPSYAAHAQTYIEGMNVHEMPERAADVIQAVARKTETQTGR